MDVLSEVRRSSITINRRWQSNWTYDCLKFVVDSFLCGVSNWLCVITYLLGALSNCSVCWIFYTEGLVLIVRNLFLTRFESSCRRNASNCNDIYLLLAWSCTHVGKQEVAVLAVVTAGITYFCVWLFALFNRRDWVLRFGDWLATRHFLASMTICHGPNAENNDKSVTRIVHFCIRHQVFHTHTITINTPEYIRSTLTTPSILVAIRRW